MIKLLIIAETSNARRWQSELLRRLGRSGYDVTVRHTESSPRRSQSLDRILRFERSRAAYSLAQRDLPPAQVAGEGAGLIIDLTGRAPPGDIPTLSVEFNGQADLASGLSSALADGFCPRLVARLDGVAVASARPMLGDRVWLGRAASDVLAAAVTLIEMCVQRFAAGVLRPLEEQVPQSPRQSDRALVGRYVPHLAKGLARRLVRRLTTRWPFHWRVAYRLAEGPGIAETGRIDGAAFTELGDDGTRFYADPFAFEWGGKSWLFVEEYPYAEAKGIISVAELLSNGRFDTPRPVIIEPHHLSYPQVFAHDGEVYMIPESSSVKELVLYRATQFPHSWVRETVLIAGRRLNDMTLLHRGDRFWLIGTEQIGQGSASDTMVAWSSPALAGPWTPHPLNPIRIDRSAARPGGRFVERDGRIFLPVQDGAVTYGGGLGLIELLELDEQSIRFGPLQPIGKGKAWAGSGIHTLTRAGRLEVIDSSG